MPVCFQLYRKADPKADAVTLQTVDDEMCKHFNVETDPDKWHHRWYDNIGLMLALGKSFTEIKTIYADNAHMVEIADWLEDNFTPDAWREIGRR